MSSMRAEALRCWSGSGRAIGVLGWRLVRQHRRNRPDSGELLWKLCDRDVAADRRRRRTGHRPSGVRSAARSANATIAVVDRVGNVLARVPVRSSAAGWPQRAGGDETGWRRRIDDQRRSRGHRAADRRGGRDREGRDRRLSVVGRQRVLVAHGVADRAAELQSRRTRPAVRTVVRRAVFAARRARISSAAFNGVAPDAGPKRSPLGLSADPGGFPLYKDGTVVGGVGVIADDLYSVDANIDERRSRASTKRSRTPPRSDLRRRSIDAATASPSTARRCASATSTSVS